MIHAFKEWAVICQALAEGRQSLILRKGGIAEKGDTFQPEHSRFWLYPTYFHEREKQEKGIKPEAAGLMKQAEAAKPPAGKVRLTHFVEVPGVYQVQDLGVLLLLNSLHLWSEETIQQRFHYRRPGIYVLPARVYQAAQPVELPETPYYAGCKSWVDLEEDLPTDGAKPVLDEGKFKDLLRKLDALLNPTALA